MTRRAVNGEPAVPAAPARDGRARMMVAALGVSGLGAALALFALPVFILVYGGLMPAILALVMDERPGRHLTITVASFNGAGLMVGLGPMFSSALSEAAAYQIVSAPETWLVIYGFAFAGWVLAWIMPLFVSQGLELVDRQRCRAIELAREAILKQWPSIAAASSRHPVEGELPWAAAPSDAPPLKSRSTSA